jgi:hypothetical protein
MEGFRAILAVENFFEINFKIFIWTSASTNPSTAANELSKYPSETFVTRKLGLVGGQS